MIEVASCELALKKTKQIGNHFKTTGAKHCFFLKTYTLKLEFDRYLECMFSIFEMVSYLFFKECRVGFPCLFLMNLAVSRLFAKNDCLIKADFSYFSNYKVT